LLRQDDAYGVFVLLGGAVHAFSRKQQINGNRKATSIGVIEEAQARVGVPATACPWQQDCEVLKNSLWQRLMQSSAGRW
jgi:hypothetical protein